MKYEEIRQAMIAAMKAHDKPRKEALTSLIEAIKKVAIDEGHRDEITDEFADRVILKEIKSVKEQIDTCPDSRQDLKEEYQLKFNVVSEFAPKQMSEEEIRQILSEKYADVIATGNNGMIMKTVMGEFKGKADGKLISQVVADLCKG